jgi:O-antigen ligase
MQVAALFLFPATALLWFPMYYEEFEQPKVAALVAFACFAGFFVDWRRLKTDRVAQALGAMVIAAAASAVLSIDWRTSVFGNLRCEGGLLFSAALLVAYLALVEVETERAISAVLACAGIVAGYAILQTIGVDFKQWYKTVQLNQYTRPQSLLGHPNFMAGYLAMALPFAVDRLNRQARYAPLVLVMTAAIFASQSRGMWIAMVISMVVYTVKRRRNTSYFVATCLLVGMIGGPFIIPHAAQEAKDRLSNIVSPGPSRLEYWDAATRIWKRYPFFGSGTDTYELAFQHQRTPHYWSIEAHGSPHRAHNDFLNELATKGIFGAAAFLFLAIVAVGLAWRTPHAAAGAAVVAYYIEGLSSFTVSGTAILLLLSLVILNRSHEKPRYRFAARILGVSPSLHSGVQADPRQHRGIDGESTWPWC